MGKPMKLWSHSDKMINYLRNAVFVINALFTVIAACVFIIGTNVSRKYNNYEAFLNAYHMRTVQMLTVAGIISTLLALLGMLGAAKYNTKCLNMQNVFLFALLVVELAVILTGTFLLTDIKTPIQTRMLQSISKFETHDKVRNVWNYVQEESHCCGVNSPGDWYPISSAFNNGSVVNYNGVYKKIPVSCCSSYNCSSSNLFQHGCLQHIADYVSDSIKVVTFVPMAAITLQIVLITLSCFLMKHIRHNKLYLNQEKELGFNRPQQVSFFISSTSLLDRSRM